MNDYNKAIEDVRKLIERQLEIENQDLNQLKKDIRKLCIE